MNKFIENWIPIIGVSSVIGIVITLIFMIWGDNYILCLKIMLTLCIIFFVCSLITKYDNKVNSNNG